MTVPILEPPTLSEPLHLETITSPDLIIASPYTTLPHLLDLTTLKTPYSLLARALTRLTPTTSSYATTPYPFAFNWPSIISTLRSFLPPPTTTTFPETSYYIIVFRSRIAVSTDRLQLGLMDEEAHKEAVKSGGLLKYWFGTPDTEGRNLATCVWRDRDDAKRGGAGKAHAQAMMAVMGLYKEWRVERLRLVVEEGARGWRIEEWKERE